jgi:hypothetical protein
MSSLDKARAAAYPGPMPAEHFAHVETWVFDLDNTLYPPETALFPQINVRMTDYVMRVTGADRAEADRLRHHYWKEHGTTLAGLMHHHGVDPDPFLVEVHEIDFTVLSPDPDLAARIAALPGRRIVYTNGTEPYARRVLEHRGFGAFRCGLRRGTRPLHAQAAARGLRDGVRDRRARPDPRRDVRGRSPQPRRAARDGDAHGACGARRPNRRITSTTTPTT